MTDRYILDGRTPVPCADLMTWAMWLETADRRVALTDHPLFRVSTVFIGLDHNFSRTGPPIVFETMAFYNEGSGLADFNCQRYATWEDAEIGHHHMVKRLMAMAASSAYRDDACAERPCDRCGQLYRGPAVYCSLTCALADA